MSFTPLMAWITARAATLLGERSTVVDLGVQTYLEADRAGTGFSGTPDHYRALGFTEHQSIDINGQAGCLVMDLNESLRSRYGYRETFALVTNCGTSEHVFDQRAFMQNAHELAKVGGIIAHAVPFLNYVNHGFYNYHPGYFLDLAAANRYEVCAIGLSNRQAHGVELAGMPLPMLKNGRKVNRAVLTSRMRFPRLGLGWFGDRKSRSDPGYVLGSAIAETIGRGKNVQVFAVLRKTADQPFRAPVQSIYAEDIADPTLRVAYAY